MLRPSLLLALAGAAASARAAEPVPPTAADLEGARALAIAAYRGLPAGNDGIFLNPAALAVPKRYALELQFLQERLDGARSWEWAQASIVDSELSAVTAGVAFTRVFDGLSTGNLWHLALAAPVGGGLHAGATGKLLQLAAAGGRRSNAATVDAGVFWQLSRLIGLGVAGYNLVPIGDELQAPKSMGAGLSVGDDRRFHVAADWRGDWQRRGKISNAWMAGAEVLIGDLVPVRGGFLRDETRGGSFWSAGLGLVSGAGLALDLSYRQAIGFPRNFTVAVGLKIFLHSG